MNDFTRRTPVSLDPVRTRFRLLGACATLGLMLGATAAQAADPAPATAPQAEAEEPGVIVVTAQRRSEDAKNVPISITAISGAELEKRKIANFEDLARVTPGISIYNTGGSNLSRIIVRGIASTQGTATVAVYLDDVSLTIPNLFFTGATLPRMMDFQQVEALRGPQGTLFGASALGGAIRFITNKPKLDTLEGSFRADVSGTNHAGANYLTEAVVNVPILADKMAWRVAIQNSKQSGFVDRIDGSGVVHKGVDEEHDTAIRTSLLYKPTDTLSIEPSFLWQKSNADGTDIFFLNLPNYQQSKLSGEPNSDELLLPSLTVHAQVGDGMELTSATSYLERINKRQFDGQVSNGIPAAAAIDPTKGTDYAVLAALPAPYTNDVHVSQWTQELRLGTPSIKESGKPWELQVGGYFSWQKVLTDDREYVTGIAQTTQTLTGQSAAAILGAPVVNDLVGSYTYATTRRELAAFAEGSLMILPRLKATVGVRQSFSHVDYTMNESGWRALGTPATVTRSGNDNPTTPKFALTWEASHDASFYANVSKGYRLGGNNSPLPTSCGSSLSSLGVNAQGVYTPDSLWSYEGGAKLRLFGNRLMVNVDGFYIDWSNIQQSVSLTSCGYVTVVNAGAARSYGGELEASLRLTKALTIGGTGSLVDAKISSAAPGSGTTDGQWLLYTPDHSFTVYGDYETALSDKLTGTAHLDANFIGKSHGSYAVTNPDYNRPAYTVVNASIGVKLGEFDLSVFAQNLLDEDKIIQRPLVVSVRQGLTVRPRTIGVSGRIRF